MEQLEDAFWTESLSVAPVATAAAVKSALIQVVSATDPSDNGEIASFKGLSQRPQRHLEDLFRLAKWFQGQWPQELSAMQSVLAADANDALHTIRVYRHEGMPRLTRWQTALVEKLNQDADQSKEHHDGGIVRDAERNAGQ